MNKGRMPGLRRVRVCQNCEYGAREGDWDEPDVVYCAHPDMDQEDNYIGDLGVCDFWKGDLKEGTWEGTASQ